MNKVWLIIFLIIGTVLGGAIYLFLQEYEYKERSVHIGFLGEARTNPLYASRLFLKRMGIPTYNKKSITAAGGLPNTNTVILISSRRTTISPRQNDELVAWVKAGGHLIAQATYNWQYYRSDNDPDIQEELESEQGEGYDSDPLQRYLGVTSDYQQDYQDLSYSDQQKVDNIEETDDGDFVRETLFKIKMKGTKKDLAMMNMWYRPILLDDNDYNDNFKEEAELITLRDDNFMLRQKAGKGMITLVSSMEFIENRHLYQADHAEILWYLVHGLNPSSNHVSNYPKAVWLIHSDKISPLWQLLWRYGWMVILSLTALLIAWFMTSNRRFGPMIPKQNNNRRSLNEHISSSGIFYWKNNQQDKLLASSRAALNRAISKHNPDWSRLNEKEQIHWLQKQLNLQPQTLKTALFANNITKADEFTQIIRLLESIRKSH